MKRLLIGLMVLTLASTVFGQQYFKKSGSSSNIIYVQMYKLTDGTLAPEIADETTILYSYIETGQAAGAAATACSDVALNAAYSSGGTHWVGWGGWFRFDVPNGAMDGAIGTDVIIKLSDGTYQGDAIIHLGTPVNAYLSDGSTPPTQATVAAAVWDESYASHVVEESFGERLGHYFDYLQYTTYNVITVMQPVAATGSTNSQIVFTNGSWFSTWNPLYAFFLVNDGSTHFQAVVCTGWDSVNYTMSVFPALVYVPTNTSTVRMKCEYSGINLMDLAKTPK